MTKAEQDFELEKDVRCVCGGLIARLVTGGVQVKCRRCKRLIVVPLVKNWEDEEDRE